MMIMIDDTETKRFRILKYRRYPLIHWQQQQQKQHWNSKKIKNRKKMIRFFFSRSSKGVAVDVVVVW